MCSIIPIYIYTLNNWRQMLNPGGRFLNPGGIHWLPQLQRPDRFESPGYFQDDPCGPGYFQATNSQKSFPEVVTWLWNTKHPSDLQKKLEDLYDLNMFFFWDFRESVVCQDARKKTYSLWIYTAEGDGLLGPGVVFKVFLHTFKDTTISNSVFDNLIKDPMRKFPTVSWRNWKCNNHQKSISSISIHQHEDTHFLSWYLGVVLTNAKELQKPSLQCTTKPLPY